MTDAHRTSDLCGATYEGEADCSAYTCRLQKGHDGFHSEVVLTSKTVVQRLREGAALWTPEIADDAALMREAADEMDRQAQEIERLRAALKHIAVRCTGHALDIAQQALRGAVETSGPIDQDPKPELCHHDDSSFCTQECHEKALRYRAWSERRWLQEHK